MASKQDLFISKIKELFQTEESDLDFGIYRILNAKHAQIDEFLNKRIPEKIIETLNSLKTDDAKDIQIQMKEIEKSSKEMGFPLETSTKYQDLKLKLTKAHDKEKIAESIYNHLYQFFSRYYSDGDFLSIRRYKSGDSSYAIPYNGEEVKLHWVTSDQYYIKSSEYLKNYRFNVGDNKFVSFKILNADTAKDNIKESNNKKRIFILHKEKPFEEVENELIINFVFEWNGKKQQEASEESIPRILEYSNVWRPFLEKQIENKSVLEKHLNSFTAKYNFDYFIHKDLGGFLRRELDFYIKNEIFFLDDIESASVPKVEEYLDTIKALRYIGKEIISLLEQTENYQKKLWLKKKFIHSNEYCFTMDLVPEEFHSEIFQNKDQLKEWEQLGFLHKSNSSILLEEIKEKSTLQSSYSLDTRHFSEDFKLRLLSKITETKPLHELLNGTLIHADNFHALNLLQETYKEKVDCVYIDPPYNAKSSEIIYKNEYKHSSWLSLIENRIEISKKILDKNNVLVIAIDEVEQEKLGLLLSMIFPEKEKVCITVVHNATGQQGSNFSFTHEFVYFIYPLKGVFIGSENRNDNPDIRPLRNVSKGSHLRTDAANCFYPILVKDGKIIGFGDVSKDDFHPQGINVTRKDGIIEIYPIDPQGIERKWVFARNSVESIIDELEPKYDIIKKQWDIIRTKKNFNYKSVWTGTKYSANSYGSRILNEILTDNLFTFPKSIFTVIDSIDAALNNASSGIILDYFAGSGTTAHAVINLNREDGGNRKYILVEMGEHFDTVLLPRIKKVVYSKDWKDGKPTSNDSGISHAVQYFQLESYEDCLNNLNLNPATEDMFSDSKTFKDEYFLEYMLDFETRNSLFTIDWFKNPFDFKMKIATSTVGDMKPTKIDLVETFHYLIGLSVERIRLHNGLRIITGILRTGEKTAIIWRDHSLCNDTNLEKYFAEQLLPIIRDKNIELIYLNGDHSLEQLRKQGEIWKILLLEEEFKHRMFENES